MYLIIDEKYFINFQFLNLLLVYMSDLFGIKIGRHRKNLGLPLEAKACIHQCVHGIQSRQVKQNLLIVLTKNEQFM